MQNVNGWFLPDGEKHLVRYLARDGEYQKKLRENALQYVKKFDCAIDVGAHCGLWTRDLAAKFKKVYAFEPIEDHLNCLVKNIKTKNVFMYQYLLGHSNHSFSPKLNPESTGSTYFKHDPSGSFRCKRLDDFEFDKVDFIKVDVEGFEYFVFRGAKQTILKHRPTINFEQKFTRYVAEGCAGAYLEKLGMRCVSKKSSERVYSFSD